MTSNLASVQVSVIKQLLADLTVKKDDENLVLLDLRTVAIAIDYITSRNWLCEERCKWVETPLKFSNAF